MPVGGFASDWSSFPSDTAAQAFALVVAIWMISRRLGIAAALWATAVICFPRLYGGFHYPSDLLVGGIFGAAATIAVARRPLGLNAAAAAMDRLEVNYRPWFYVFGFCLLFEITGHFEDAREALNIGKHIIQPMLNLLPDST
jgi:undecaprenyl-diphosphatase